MSDDLSSLQPTSQQAYADNLLLGAEARRAAAEEDREEYERYLTEQASAHIDGLATRFDGTVRGWAAGAQEAITNLTTLTQQGSIGLLSATEFSTAFNRLNREVALLRQEYENLVQQVDTLEEWEMDPITNISRLLPPAMRRTP